MRFRNQSLNKKIPFNFFTYSHVRTRKFIIKKIAQHVALDFNYLPPPFQTIILSHDYYRFSASQSEILPRKCLHEKKPDRQKNRRSFFDLKKDWKNL